MKGCTGDRGDDARRPDASELFASSSGWLHVLRSSRAGRVSSSAFRRFTVITLAFTLAVIVWGAYVRATGSGAGCGDHWPNCNGEVIPRAPSVQTMIEYTHRTTSGLSLILVLIMAVWAWRTHASGHPVRRAAVASLIFIVLEAALGAGLVLLELVALDASARRAIAMSLHLTNTFLLLTALGATVFGAWFGDEKPRRPSAILLGVHAALMLVGISGAVAALGDTLTQHGVANAFVALLIRLRVAHPVLAVSAAIFSAFVASALWNSRPGARKFIQVWVVLLLAQLVAGVVNVGLNAPVSMQLIHLLLADLVWLAVVFTGLATANEATAQPPSFAGSGAALTTSSEANGPPS